MKSPSPLTFTPPARLAVCWCILALWLGGSIALLWQLEWRIAPFGAYCRTAPIDTGAFP